MKSEYQQGYDDALTVNANAARAWDYDRRIAKWLLAESEWRSGKAYDAGLRDGYSEDVYNKGYDAGFSDGYNEGKHEFLYTAGLDLDVAKWLIAEKDYQLQLAYGLKHMRDQDFIDYYGLSARARGREILDGS